MLHNNKINQAPNQKKKIILYTHACRMKRGRKTKNCKQKPNKNLHKNYIVKWQQQ